MKREQIGSESAARFAIGDKVVIACHDEGYSGQVGTVVAVFRSGRCQVKVEPISLLILPQEALQHVVPD
jgi:hypothetical protein